MASKASEDKASNGERSSKPTLPMPPLQAAAPSRLPSAAVDPTIAQPKWPVAQSPPPRSGLQGEFLVLAAGTLLALTSIVAAIVVAYALFYTSDRVMPGVQVLGVELGGKSTIEATALLQQYWGTRTIILDAGESTWTVTPPMLGIMLNAETTVQAAYQQGRSLATLAGLLQKGGVHISPAWSVSPAIAEANLLALRSQFDVPPVDASLRVVDGRVEALPALSGRALDVAATLAGLVQDPAQVINEGRLKLVMTPVQPAIVDVSAVVAQANQLLASPLSIRVYDPITDERQAWDVSPGVWGAWLSLGAAPHDPTQLDWELDVEEAQAFLTEQAATLGPDRYLDLGEAVAALGAAIETHSPEVRVRVYHRERQHVVQAGETLSSIATRYGLPYPWIQEANPGMGDVLYAGQVVVIPSPDVLLPLPVVEDKRVVVSLEQQRMWVFQNDALKWEWPVSTGISSSPTAPGVFQIQTHEPNAYASNWNLWMPHFMGIYRPLPTSDFMNGFHGFPTREGSTLLWTGDLGHPVTYGCILISSENASALYEWAEAGVVVEVQP